VIRISLTRWLSSLFFMANYSLSEANWYVGHFWSLAVEEHFYLIWPAVLLLVRGNRKRLALAIGAALAVALWRAVDFKFRLTWTDSAWFWGRTDINADGILFGVIYALALRDPQIAPALKRILSNSLAAPLSIALFVLTVVLPSMLGWKLGFMLITVRAAAVPAMLLATLHNPTHFLGRILELKPLCFVGLISYSLYLWQQLFLVWEPNPALHPVQWFPVNIAAAALCAVMSFYFVETPLIRLGRSVFGYSRAKNVARRNFSRRPVRGKGDDECDAVV
jgi:peptidoglycan/LPS O-acetylase OafA/YrhL